MSVAYIQTDTRLARFHSIFSIQPVTIAPCAQKVEFLWSDFRLHTNDCLLDENQSFRKRRGKHWTIPGHRCLTPEIRFWFTYSFRFSTVGFAPTKKKEAKHKQHSQIFTTQRYEQKHTKLIFPFIYTHKRFSYFFRFTCNTLFICIKQSIMQYKRARWSIEMQKSGAFSHWLKNPNRFIYLGKSEPEFLSVFIFSLCNFRFDFFSCFRVTIYWTTFMSCFAVGPIPNIMNGEKSIITIIEYWNI